MPQPSFRRGTAQISASYAGDGNFSASTAAAQALTIAKATSTTTLTLSPAKVTYGHEQAGKITATVVPQYTGTPTGKVTVTAGTGATVCVITLSGGSGECVLKATQFSPGAVKLTASYSGDGNFTAAASGIATLTIAKATTKTGLTLSASTTTYGKEKTEKLTVTATPQYAASFRVPSPSPPPPARRRRSSRRSPSRTARGPAR